MQKIGARARNKMRAIIACNKIEKRIIFHFLRWKKEERRKKEEKKEKKKKQEKKRNREERFEP